jgi:hypothetical protein
VTEGDGEDDHIAVILNVKLCHHLCCVEANFKGMQFADGFAEAAEDVLFAFQILQAHQLRMNKEIDEKGVEKPTKKLRARKADAVIGTQETGETVETKESQKRR